jgi:hypothetical protein
MIPAELKQFAQNTLKSKTATDADKRKAREAIDRIRVQKKNKAEIAELCGKKPTRKAFANDELYRAALTTHQRSRWDALDRRAIRKQAEKILNGKDSTPLERRNARARLESLDGPPPQPEDEPDEKKSTTFPTREDFGFLSGLDWPEFVASGKEAEFQAALEKWRQTAPPLDPRIAAFLNALDDESFDVPQPVTPKPPIVAPIDPALFCEHCGVALRICGCDRVICSLCLRPQIACFSPCQNSSRRS